MFKTIVFINFIKNWPFAIISFRLLSIYNLKFDISITLKILNWFESTWYSTLILQVSWMISLIKYIAYTVYLQRHKKAKNRQIIAIMLSIKYLTILNLNGTMYWTCTYLIWIPKSIMKCLLSFYWDTKRKTCKNCHHNDIQRLNKFESNGSTVLILQVSWMLNKIAFLIWLPHTYSLAYGNLI